MSKIIAIEGAPRSGKTSLSVELARRLIARRAPACVVGPPDRKDPTGHMAHLIVTSREITEMVGRGVIVVLDTYLGGFLADHTVCRGGYIPAAAAKLQQAIDMFGLIPPRLMVCLSAETSVLCARSLSHDLPADVASNARFAYGNPRLWWNLSDSTCLDSGKLTTAELADKLDLVVDELVRASAVIPSKQVLQRLSDDIDYYAELNGMNPTQEVAESPEESADPDGGDDSVLSAKQWP